MTIGAGPPWVVPPWLVGLLDRVAGGVGAIPGWRGAAASAYAGAEIEVRRRAADLADALTAPDPAHARAVVEAVTAGGRLLAHDPLAFGGDGRVVLAVGDAESAEDLALLVPGVGTDAGDAAALTDRALAVQRAADRAEADEEHAVLVWVGYDAPAGPGALTESMARAGGALLAADVAALRAARADEPAHLTVVGHSYGATTVAHAATTTAGLAAEDVVLAGSPGAGDAEHAAALGPGRVWVLRNSLDPVAALGTAGPLGLGVDPALEEFGATRLRAESQERGFDWPAADHASYFAPGGEAMDNLAHVVTGHPDRVIVAPPLRDPWWSPPLDPELGREPGH